MKTHWHKAVFSLAAVIILGCLNPILGQENPSNQQYLSKGILISTEELSKIPNELHPSVLNFPFDQYRNESTRRTILVNDLFSLELASFDEMRDQSISFNDSLAQNKSPEGSSNGLHPIITKVSVGLPSSNTNFKKN